MAEYPLPQTCHSFTLTSAAPKAGQSENQPDGLQPALKILIVEAGNAEEPDYVGGASLDYHERYVRRSTDERDLDSGYHAVAQRQRYEPSESNIF